MLLKCYFSHSWKEIKNLFNHSSEPDRGSNMDPLHIKSLTTTPLLLPLLRRTNLNAKTNKTADRLHQSISQKCFTIWPKPHLTLSTSSTYASRSTTDASRTFLFLGICLFFMGTAIQSCFFTSSASTSEPTQQGNKHHVLSVRHIFNFFLHILFP